MFDRMRLLMARALLCSAVVAGVVVAPVWAQPQVPEISDADAAALESVLIPAEDHGLGEPGDRSLQSSLRSTDPAARVAAREQLRSRVLRYASDQHAGRATPALVDRRWSYRPAAYEAGQVLDAALAQGQVREWVRSLPPGHTGYLTLVAARRRYAAFAAGAGWPVTPAGPALKAGAEGPQVAALRARLEAQGYASGEEDVRESFGPGLTAALQAFQAAHGLTADGVLGPQSREALNVPAADRLRQIDLSLERWRWLPRTLPPRRVEVNVAGAEAALVEGDADVLRMRIVVGDLTHKTPLFSSEVHSVVFNPPWNVPASIAQAELLPRARRDPGYLARNRFSFVNGQLRQAPGPGNALGRIKLDFDNPFGVYLHDTPGKAAFARTRRTLSHGCMRLEKPAELAALLLASQGWSRADVDAAIDAGSTRRVRLTTPTPIFVSYQTAWVQPDGRVAFRPDAYGWDAELAAALTPRPAVADLQVRLESECANAHFPA